ncbi:MAG: hypothetical protein ACKOW9_05755 [Candidatus Paceibacterota bacterium]
MQKRNNNPETQIGAIKAENAINKVIKALFSMSLYYKIPTKRQTLA